MKTNLQIQESIAAAIREAVSSNDEGLLDAAVQDYQSLLKVLVSKGRYRAIDNLVGTITRIHTPTGLINLKGAISSGVLTKAMALTALRMQGLPSKSSARSNSYDRRPRVEDLAPNAEQSIAIAKSLLISRDDDLSEMTHGLRYFARLGHQQAMAIIIAHCLSHGLTAQDEACEIFGSLTHLAGNGSLHSSLLRVLKDRKKLVEAEFQRMASRWSSLASTTNFRQVFSLDMLEKMHRQGLDEQTLIFARAYDQIYLSGVDQEICVIPRLLRLGVESVAIVSASQKGRSGYSFDVSPVPWIEHLLTNNAVEPIEIAEHFRDFNYCTLRRDAPFQAIWQVLEYQASLGNDSAIDRPKMIVKAAELIQVVIDGRSISSNNQELSRIIEEFDLPNELTLKVKRLKGIVLEHDLGM